VILFPGSLQWHQGVDIAIEAFARIKPQIPQAEFHIYCGSGVIQGDLKDLTQKLGVEDSVKFFKAVPLDEMAQVIADADLGVVPKRADSFGNEAYSTKIMEFMSQGVPVVVSRTKIDSYYFEEGVVHFFKSGDSESMASAMLDVIQKKELRDSLVRSGYQYVERHSWDCKKKEYLDLIDSLATEDFAGMQSAGLPLEAGKVHDGFPPESSILGGGEDVSFVSEIARVSRDLENRPAISSLESDESEKRQAARI
jgi:glycosyltransferase involved in cell wall biosynthesis